MSKAAAKTPDEPMAKAISKAGPYTNRRASEGRDGVDCLSSVQVKALISTSISSNIERKYFHQCRDFSNNII
ncbi:MAG: hypothetical protein HKN28_09370 [Alphaproteobacteria bacterium]|nr:hypothetical protein [Alphaproteobacteria bacterium]